MVLTKLYILSFQRAYVNYCVRLQFYLEPMYEYMTLQKLKKMCSNYTGT